MANFVWNTDGLSKSVLATECVDAMIVSIMDLQNDVQLNYGGCDTRMDTWWWFRNCGLEWCQND